ILKAAEQVFTEKGYEATKTRDIAEAADINIASLHYYFRSKEKLFQLVMGKKLGEFHHLITKMVNGEDPLYVKIRAFVPAYIDFIRENPHLPMFILSEMQNNVEQLEARIGGGAPVESLKRQLKELAEQGIIRPLSIENFMSNLIGLVIFPTLARPMLEFQTGINEEGFEEMLEQRKKMIPDMIIKSLYINPPE
ncbi:MAG: TetR/AcrR family transcriptional regulator, partial [Bacteroidota bacterium]